jgi:hypothetical protein
VNVLSASSAALVVIAAGNEGPAAGTVGSPGSIAASLTMGAVVRTDAMAESGDVHLGDAEMSADPGLGEFFHEPHVDDLPVPLIEFGEQRDEGVEVLHRFQPLVFGTDEVLKGALTVFDPASIPPIAACAALSCTRDCTTTCPATRTRTCSSGCGRSCAPWPARWSHSDSTSEA